MIRLNGVDKESTIGNVSQISHGAYVLADNPNLYEIQRTNNFEFIVTDIDNILRAGAGGSETTSTIDNAQEVLRISVSGAFVPHYTQESIPIRRGNSVQKFAGVPTFQAGRITLNDYIGADTKAVLMAWQNLSYNVRTEKVGLVTDYKKDAYLLEYTPDYQLVRTWKLFGCWISGLSEGEFSHDSADKHTISATIEYDKAWIDISDVEG
jgi:hypothetical protein